MGNDHDEFFWLLVGVAALIAGLFIGQMVGKDIGENSFKQEAVDAGAAYWQATPDGQVEFHWVILDTKDSKDEQR